MGKKEYMCRNVIAVCAGGALALGIIGRPVAATADTSVSTGWDLLMTDAGLTSFLGVPWQGVPLGSFDFGGVIGQEGVGLTDTIVRRLEAAHAPVETIPIELVALQLQSVMPVDLGAGLGIHYITLQSQRGGPASAGRMTIQFGAEGVPHGHFDSFFDVFFDVRLGALDGPIVASDSLPLVSVPTPWHHDPPPNSMLIDGINRNLNGVDPATDFWPVGSIVEQHPLGLHVVEPTPEIPEGGPFLSMAVLAMIVGTVWCRRLHGAVADRRGVEAGLA